MSANAAALQVALPLGVVGRTVQNWAEAAGTPLGDSSRGRAKTMAPNDETLFRARRAQLKARLLDEVFWLLDKMHSTEKDQAAKNWSVAAAVMIDKMQLVAGEPTSRNAVTTEQAAQTLEGFLAEAESHANAQ